jgi:hypothetical protein
MSIAFASAILAAATLSAQEKVAVLPPLAGRNVSDINKKTVRSAFLDYISEPSSGFAAFDRHSIDLMIQRESTGKPNMLYDEKVAIDIGKKLGVPLVCIIDLTRDERDFLIECKLVRVDTGRAVSKSEIVSSLTNAEIKKASEAVIRKLMAGAVTTIKGVPAARTESPSRAAAATTPTPSQAAAVRAESPAKAAAPPINASGNASKSVKETTHGGGWSYGVSLAIAHPGGDLTNNKDLLGDDLLLKLKTGFGISAFGEFGINDKMAIRGRVDYNVFGAGKIEESYSDDYDYGKETVTLNADATTVFADFIYSFNSHDKGPYAFAGLGFVNGKLTLEQKEEWSYDGDSGKRSRSQSESGGNLGYALGLGYNFTKNMGAELSYVTANDVIKPKDWDKKFGFTWMQASFKYRFGYDNVSKSVSEPKKSLTPSHDSGWSYGVSLAIAHPGGDFTNEKIFGNKIKTGLGISAFGEFGLNDKMALRGRVDYIIFGEGKNEYSDNYGKRTDTLSANVATVFADYIYSFDSHEKGLYAFAGLGFVNGKFTREGKVEETRGGDTETRKSIYSDSGSNLGYALGLGYNFTKNAGVELSYVTANDVIKPKGTILTFGFTWLQASFRYRF